MVDHCGGFPAFLIPVVIVTFALRKHLLRGVTFGAIRHMQVKGQ